MKYLPLLSGQTISTTEYQTTFFYIVFSNGLIVGFIKEKLKRKTEGCPGKCAMRDKSLDGPAASIGSLGNDCAVER